jgi:uncharacterized membrane protein
MDKETSTILLFLVALLLVFAIAQPLFPSTAERFSELGVLGPSQTIGTYPTNVTAGHSFLLYGYIANHEGQAAYYQLEVKLGSQNTQISNTTSASAPVIFDYSRVLLDNQSFVFPMNLTLGTAGMNERVIFELWDYNATGQSFVYTGLWNQLWMNVTA